jgi:flagellar hook protein FlgE
MIPVRDRHEFQKTGEAAHRLAGLLARHARRGRICRQPGRRVLRSGARDARYNQKLFLFNIYNFGTNSACGPAASGPLAEGFVGRGLVQSLNDEVSAMGIFGALTTAVSGLTAQSFSLENISGNIANSRTTGFKRVDTAFSTLVPDLPGGRELAGSVGAYSRNMIGKQGDLLSSVVETNMAIAGEGMFTVKQRTSVSDGVPVFGGQNLYTRRGDFDVDRNGYLVNGSGYSLMGYPVDPITASPTGSALQVIRVSNDNLAARATTEVTYRANLPRYPRTGLSDITVPGSELLSGAAYTGATIAASDETGFLNRTIAGQAITVYNSIGTAVDAQIRWGKTSNTAGAETWSAYYLSASDATGAAPKWTQLVSGVTFDGNGRMTAPASGSISVTFTVDGSTSGAIDIAFGASGLSQFADSNGTVNINTLSQDGYPSGIRTGLQIGEGGRVVGIYSNGQTVALAQVPLAQFASDNLLKRKDGGVFEETLESGAPIYVDAGRNLAGGTLEGSNADIADEFSKMIVTQQAYSANTRIITTAQQMLQDTINIVR